jgi:hypothetical protein
MKTKKEIGGYFELELNPEKKEYHSGAIKLNCGRSCIQYVINAKKYKKIYIPSYICDSILKPIKDENISYEFYSINKYFEPIFNKTINDNDCFLYVNYFGINGRNANIFALNFKNIIVDNSQAFFEVPYKNFDTFYSARKFFGVPDGAYLYTDTLYDIPLKRDVSLDRMEHLLKRIEISANDGFAIFQKNECDLGDNGLCSMSKLTETILGSIDYEKCRYKRNSNFLFLHEKLSKYNELDIDINNLNGPMIYPFMNSTPNLKEKLINNNIYVATYWKDVLQRVKNNSFEYKLANCLIPLPIDQRYNLEDMNIMVNLIDSFGVLK